MQSIIKTLTDIGLGIKESQVYIACLECGTAPASKVARKAKLNRVTTYNILQQLLKQGLVSTSIKQSVQHFTALDPASLLEESRHRTQKLEKALPYLLSLSSDPKDRPKVQFFEGLEAVKVAYNQTLESRSEILDYANSKNIRIHWPQYDTEYVAKRQEKHIFLRGLAPDDPQGRRVVELDKESFRETRLIPKKLFWVENEIKIFDDKMFIASFEPQPFAILIQSQTVADTQRQIFEIAWTYASR